MSATAPDRVVAVRDLLPTDNQRRAAELLPDAMRAYYPDVLDAIAAALDEAEQRGRDSVGLGDFLPDPCGEETRVAYPHDYGWLRCSRRAGHDGDHEESSTGFTWSTS